LIVAKPEDFFMCSSGYSFWLMITFWIHLTSGLPGVQAASLEGFAGQDEVARRPRDRKLCHINRARQGRPNRKKIKRRRRQQRRRRLGHWVHCATWSNTKLTATKTLQPSTATPPSRDRTAQLFHWVLCSGFSAVDDFRLDWEIIWRARAQALERSWAEVPMSPSPRTMSHAGENKQTRAARPWLVRR